MKALLFGFPSLDHKEEEEEEEEARDCAKMNRKSSYKTVMAMAMVRKLERAADERIRVTHENKSSFRK